MKSRPKILIVGGGVSGLMAAEQLLLKNHEVIIVEARERVGGRILELKEPFSAPVEAGAEFIHGDQPITMELIEEAKLSLTPVDGNFYSLREGRLVNDGTFDGEWGSMLEKLSHLREDETMSSFLTHNFAEKKYAGLRQNVTGFVEGYDAADMNLVSAFSLREEWARGNDENQYRIDGGYYQLVQHLQKKVTSLGGKIFLSSPVKEIQWRENHVRLVIENGTSFDGDKLIVTVSLGVLQNDVLSFNPPLPDKYREAFKNIGFGSVIKFLFEFDQEFWDQVIMGKRKNMSFHFSDAPVPTWWTQYPSEIPLLTGWLGGPSVKQSGNDADRLFARAVDSLAYIFGCSSTAVETNIHASLITNWAEDPFSLGSYAYSTVKSKSARELLSGPLAETIFFAGEALYDGPAIGTVEAALQSGISVASRI